MKEHKCILSEKPDALDGALEWLQSEIERMEKEDKVKVTQELEEYIRPFVLEIAKKRGLVSAR